MHNAAGRTSSANAAKVAAGTSPPTPQSSNTGRANNHLPVVVFGDPKKGQSLSPIAASKVLTICHDGDNICEGGSSITIAHLTYQMDVGTAGAFVAGKV